MTYPNLMTSKKAKLLITAAWILSFVICFPPLVGWNDKYEGLGFNANNTGNTSDLNESPEDLEVKEILKRCRPECMLNQEPGYVIYSAVGSFYAPMLVMMFLNWRIYRYTYYLSHREAIIQMHALHTGMHLRSTTHGSSGNNDGVEPGGQDSGTEG
jgi:hypothetical protein